MNISAFGGANIYYATLPKSTDSMQREQASQGAENSHTKLPQTAIVSPSFQGGNASPNGQQGGFFDLPRGAEQMAVDNQQARELREKLQKDSKGCGACENRKYQDGSNDASVSFKSPTNIDPRAVAGAVRSHEQEHVAHEQYKAQREQRKIISQTVALHTGICGECGRVFISGGTTRTVSKAKDTSVADQFSVGKQNTGKDQRVFSATA